MESRPKFEVGDLCLLSPAVFTLQEGRSSAVAIVREVIAFKKYSYGYGYDYQYRIYSEGASFGSVPERGLIQATPLVKALYGL